MDKKQLLLEIKDNPTQYIDLIINAYNKQLLSFEEHFDLIILCNKKFQTNIDPLQELQKMYDLKHPKQPLSNEDEILVSELRALIRQAKEIEDGCK